jgi:hypothetical protein
MKINWKAVGIATFGTFVVAGIGYIISILLDVEWAIYMIGAFWVAQYHLNDR